MPMPRLVRGLFRAHSRNALHSSLLWPALDVLHCLKACRGTEHHDTYLRSLLLVPRCFFSSQTVSLACHSTSQEQVLLLLNTNDTATPIGRSHKVHHVMCWRLR